MSTQYETATKQVEAIRRSGVTNMLEVGTVQLYAKEVEAHELLLEIEQGSNSDYMDLLTEAAERDFGTEATEEIEQLAETARNTTVTVEV